jgi:hypothetical protein
MQLQLLEHYIKENQLELLVILDVLVFREVK